MTRSKTTLERSFPATLAEAWALWTTADGIESWWGPVGFEVKVRSIDLRPGGRLTYAMTAVAPEQRAFLERAGMPLTTVTSLDYVEVVPNQRLAYVNRVDFVPGHPPYDVGTVVELTEVGDRVRIVLTLDPMHDGEWTSRAVQGWESELGKLDALLALRRTA